MATLDVVLPDQLKDWVETRARTGQYVDAGDYVRDLIRRDQKLSETIADVQGLIDEGLASGVSEHSMDEIVAIARRRATSPVAE